MNWSCCLLLFWGHVEGTETHVSKHFREHVLLQGVMDICREGFSHPLMDTGSSPGQSVCKLFPAHTTHRFDGGNGVPRATGRGQCDYPGCRIVNGSPVLIKRKDPQFQRALCNWLPLQFVVDFLCCHPTMLKSISGSYGSSTVFYWN
jgi:hypothetical protein